LFANRRDAIWLTLRIEDADPGLAHEFSTLAPDQAAKRLGALRRRLVSLAEATRARSSAALLVSNFSCPQRLDLFDANSPDSLTHLVAAENRELARDLSRLPGVHVFDWNGLVTELGSGAWIDPKLWYLARVAVGAGSQPALARRLARCLRAVLTPAAK